MTNWPSIQEYRNFEAKFFDSSCENNYIYSAENDVETVAKPGFEPESENYVTTKPESKTVRCIIKKDFEETFRKLDRGDGIHESVEVKSQEPPRLNQVNVNKIRLQNHLKWKKQKEKEYLQKKEAERIEQQKKEEEILRMEQVKRQKEKERQEKLKMWEEQKTREKKEKKREKIVMKELEHELKEVAPVVNKEKLIKEWVKLKNKQKQMEMEKKAEISKKEEESKALRQSLAEISYRQWKQRIKGRMMTLPKNGYQIFGPKPVPVVKEDWNNDFIKSYSPRKTVSLKTTKSSTTSLNSKLQLKDLEQYPRVVFGVDEQKNRSASFYNLKTAKGKFNISGEILSEAQHEMCLKELKSEIIDLKNNWAQNISGGYEEGNFGVTELNTVQSFASLKNERLSPSQRLKSTNFFESEDRNCYVSEIEQNNLSHVSSQFFHESILPNKTKIDLYMNTCLGKVKENVLPKPENRTLRNAYDVRNQREKNKPIGDSKLVSESKKNVSIGKLTNQKSLFCMFSETNVRKKLTTGKNKKPVKSEGETKPCCRESRSYDKPGKKISKDQLATKECLSLIKIKGPRSESEKSSKSKGSCCKKKKSKKQSMPNTPEIEMKSNKFKTSSELNVRKKQKKKNPFISKSLSCSESPYCIKKACTRPNPGKRQKKKEVRRKAAESY